MSSSIFITSATASRPTTTPSPLGSCTSGGWSADQLDYDNQSTAYLMAARAMEIPAEAVALVVTTKAKKPDVQIERLVRHPRDEDELVELAVTVLAAVEAGIDHRIRGWQCKTCPYAGECQP